MPIRSQPNGKDDPSVNLSSKVAGGTKMSFKKIQLLAQIVGFLTIGFLSIFGALSIAGDTSPAWAALGQASPSMSPRVPNVINYQGMLRQADGSVMNGTYDMTFRLYDSPTGGPPVHTETLTGVLVRDGLFTVLLGDAADNPINAAAFQKPLDVGIQVENGAEMVPRQRIAPVPYAVQLTDGVYVDESGRVGIDTTGPKKALHVDGDYYGKGHMWLYANEGDGNNGTAYIQARDDSSSSNIALQFRTKNAEQIRDVMKLTSDGNVEWTGHLGSMTKQMYYTAHLEDQSGTSCTRMTPFDYSVCYLAKVSMADIDGEHETAQCFVQEVDGAWRLCASLSDTGDANVWCEAHCLEW